MDFGVENWPEGPDVRHRTRLDPSPDPESCLSVTLLLLHGWRLRPLSQLGINVTHDLVVSCHTEALLLTSCGCDSCWVH